MRAPQPAHRAARPRGDEEHAARKDEEAPGARTALERTCGAGVVARSCSRSAAFSARAPRGCAGRMKLRARAVRALAHDRRRRAS